MKLDLQRVVLTPECTVGVLRIDGRHECFTMEDVVREVEGQPFVKVPGKTAIPRGIYRVEITHSPRFGVDMPLVLDVPHFKGIRMHPGNDADDTEGCLLPGANVLRDPAQLSRFYVTESRAAYSALFAKLKKATANIELTIR